MVHEFLIQTSLRPIRSALLVDLSEQLAIRAAIELLSSHWGGRYSCIVPITSEMLRFDCRTDARRAVENLLQCFEPDFVYIFEDAHKDLVESTWPVFKLSFTDRFKLGHLGLSILPSLLAYSQSYANIDTSQRMLFSGQTGNSTDELLTAITLGVVPNSIVQEYIEQYSTIPRINHIHSEQSATSLFDMVSKSILAAGSYGISNFCHSRNSLDLVLLFDKTHVSNLIELWNLRALGLNILPVEINERNVFQLVQDALVQKQDFSRVCLRYFKNVEHDYVDELRFLVSKLADPCLDSKLIDIGGFQPERWRADRINPVSKVVDRRQSEVDGHLEIPVLMPSFFDILRDREWGSGVLWVNTARVFPLRRNHKIAHVLPIGARGNSFDFGDDRGSPNMHTSEGFVNGFSGSKIEYRLKLPNAWIVLKRYLKTLGVSVKRSNASVAIFEMLDVLGDIENIKYFSSRETLRLLEDLAQGFIESENSENLLSDSISEQTKKFKGFTVSYPALLKTLASSPHSTEKFALQTLRFFTEKQIFTMGLRCC